MSLKNFNNQLLDLSTQIQEMYPDDNNILLFLQTLKLLIKTNVKKPIEYFTKYVYIYKNEIMNENESFFISDINYSDINNNYIPNLDNIIDILKLKWNKMNDNSKQNIWKYLKVLVILREQYYS